MWINKKKSKFKRCVKILNKKYCITRSGSLYIIRNRNKLFKISKAKAKTSFVPYGVRKAIRKQRRKVKRIIKKKLKKKRKRKRKKKPQNFSYKTKKRTRKRSSRKAREKKKIIKKYVTHKYIVHYTPANLHERKKTPTLEGYIRNIFINKPKSVKSKKPVVKSRKLYTGIPRIVVDGEVVRSKDVIDSKIPVVKGISVN